MYPKNGSHSLVRKSNAHDTAENLAATAAVYGGYLVTRPIKITGLRFYVTTIIAASSTAPVIEVNRRVTYNDGTGEVQMASMTIPNGGAVGKVYVKRIEPVLCYPGDEISLEHVTQAVDGGTATGAGFYALDYEDVHEADGNCGDLVVL